MPALEKLGLRENEIEGEGMLHLSKMSCNRLAQLYLGISVLTQPVIRFL